VPLPTDICKRFGYDLEFDDDARYDMTLEHK